MTGPRVRLARPDELPLCRDIRHEVFVVGQGVPPSIEQDGRDDEAVHVLAFVDGVPVGTARFRTVQGVAKAERVAVRQAYRDLGLGVALMEALEDAARARGLRRMTLHAQAPVIAFYERLGYEGHGARFFEADIEHLAMSRSLD